jgi:hypothetical protein
VVLTGVTVRASVEVPSGHVVMVSHPDDVVSLIESAVKKIA